MDSEKKFFIDVETHQKIFVNANQRVGTKTNEGLYISLQPFNDGGLIVSAGRADANGVKAVKVATWNKVVTTLKKIDKSIKFVEVVVNTTTHKIDFIVNRPATVAINAGDCLTTESKAHKKNGKLIWSNRLCFKKNKSAEKLEMKKLSFSITYKKWTEKSTELKDFISVLSETEIKKIEKSFNGYVAETFFYNNLNDWYSHFKKAEKAKSGGDIDGWIGIQPIQIKCCLQNDPDYGFFCKKSQGVSKSNGFGPQLDLLFKFSFSEIAEKLNK